MRGRAVPPALLALGLLALGVAEGALGEGHPQRAAWTVGAVALLLVAAVLRGVAWARGDGARRSIEGRLGLGTAAVGLSLLLWGAGRGLGGDAAPALRLIGLAALAASLGALAPMELVRLRGPADRAVDPRRVGAAAGLGSTLALSAVFAVCVNWAASRRDAVVDLSYLRTTEPSEATRELVARLDEPVRVILFYPPVNEVRGALRPYFDALAERSDALTVEVRDHALAPELARAHRVRGNGVVLLVRGAGGADGAPRPSERIEVGEDFDVARDRLRTLDGLFREHLARLTVRPRTLRFTAGHRERGAPGDPEGEGLEALGAVLARSNLRRRPLGIAQGLARAVPDDARAVVVTGPRAPMLPEEARSLRRHVARGGRLLVMLDPDEDHGLEPLLRGLGLALRDGVLHAARDHLRLGRGVADRAVVQAPATSAHPVVSEAHRERRDAAAVLDRGGALAPHDGGGAIEGVEVTFPLRTPAEGFWLDRDGDHARDPDEPADRAFAVMAAVRVAGAREGRAVVIADGDFATDRWMRNRANALVVQDALDWLLRDDVVVGPSESEEDVTLVRTRDEALLWFFGTTCGAPLPPLVVGLWLAVRRARGRRRPTRRRAS